MADSAILGGATGVPVVMATVATVAVGVVEHDVADRGISMATEANGESSRGVER